LRNIGLLLAMARTGIMANEEQAMDESRERSPTEPLMTPVPQTQYAQSGEISIAYQVVGSGPLDLIVTPGFVSHLDCSWEEPSFARCLNRLASFCRLIHFDKRGTGLSDRDAGIPSLEQRMDDIRAVLDAAGSRRAAILGVSEGGPMSALFAATYPERTEALILYGTYAKAAWAPDYPWGARLDNAAARDEETRRTWGSPASVRRNVQGWLAPSRANDERFCEWIAKLTRLGASPGAAVALQRMNRLIDVRDVLPSIHVPTLVMRRADDPVSPIEPCRYMVEHIPGAKYVELQGVDHMYFVGDADIIVDEIQEFLTGERSTPEPDRILATVLFTDIVGSTGRAIELGDARWRELLESHNAAAQHAIARFRGRGIKSTGDGILATFDGPARAVRCACALRDDVRRLGLEIRAGLHAGEIELMGHDIGGIAVHTAARVAGKAEASEIWVSRTVKDLVAGSGLEFSERGVFELKGIPGSWPLFTVNG
jgi:pimeloyl-ACP methyl ester carboxylesterase/class 3 adenylate cyclase